MSYTSQDIRNIIVDIEKNFDVTKLNYKSINFWPIVRREVQHNLSYNIANNDEVNWQDLEAKRSKKSFYKFLKYCIYHFRYLIYAKTHRINCDFLVNGYAASLYKKNNAELLYNQYVDPYFEALSKVNYISVKKIILNEEFIKLNGITQFPILNIAESRFEKLLYLKKVLFNHVNAEKGQVENLKNLVTQINALIVEKYRYLPITRSVFSHLEIIENYKNIYKLALKSTRAKALFSEGCYDNNNFGLVLACKELNIKTIELQHGVIEDAVYGPYIKTHNYNLLPNYIWTWNVRDAEVISKNKLNKNYVPLPLGNLWVTKCVQEELSTQAINYFKDVRTKFLKIITITLQPNFLIHKELEYFINSNPDYCFLLKKHPNNSEEEIKELETQFLNNENVIFESVFSLISVFKNSDAHITHSSASAMESLSVGIKTIINSSYGKLFYEDYINNNLMFYAETQSHYAQLIRSDSLVDVKVRKKYSVIASLEQIQKAVDQYFLN